MAANNNYFLIKLTCLLLAVLASASANQYHVDWSTSTCVEGSGDPWDELYGDLDECCAKALWWKMEECHVTKPPTPRPSRTPRPTPKPTPRPQSTPSFQSTPRPSPSSPSMPISRPTRRNRNKLKMFPSDDTFISESQPQKNYASRDSLHVRDTRGPRVSLLKYDLAAVRGQCIKKAKLHLYSCSHAESGGVVSVCSASRKKSLQRRWKETDATWISTKPLMKSAVVLKSLGRVEEDQWVGVDVTSAIKNASHLTFLLSSDGPAAKYASKERLEHSPYIEVTLC